MPECVFCRIVARRALATIVYETTAVLGLLPLVQESRGHTLLIPKRHAESIFDIDGDQPIASALSAKELAQQLVRQHGATGVNILHASGRDAQQSVFHFHLHLIPRYPNDGLDLWIRSGG